MGECRGIFWMACWSLPYSVAQDGRRIALSRTVPIDDTTAAVHLTLISVDGDTLFAIEHRVPLIPIRAAYVDSVRHYADSIDARDAAKDSLAPRRPQSRVAPSHFTPVRWVHAGRSGSVWLGLRSGGRDIDWHLFDSTGHAVGRVLLPEKARLMEADLDHAWTVEERADSTSEVVLYRLRRPHPQ